MQDFDNNMPIYIQLIDRLQSQILSGKLSPGEKLDSVRGLADLYQVNPNTVQRSLADLESSGLIVSKRAVGKFVTEDVRLISAVREKHIDDEIRSMLEKLYKEGYTKEEIYSSLKKLLEVGK